MSFTNVSKSVIMNCCENYMRLRQERIDKEIETYVTKAMTPKKKKFLWFSREEKFAATREEAMEWIHIRGHYMMMSAMDWIVEAGKKRAIIVESLMRLCAKSADDTILLSNEHSWILEYVDKIN